jgi:rhamnulokinase
MSLRTLIVVGGGAQNELLNELTAGAAGVEVRPGHVEASTIGNIMNQQLALRRS